LQSSAEKVIIFAHYEIKTGERLNAETLSVDCNGNSCEKLPAALCTLKFSKGEI